MSTATQIAHMPPGANTVLDRRTLERDNMNLLPLLKKGMAVMDVGCGSGAITKGIAERVGPNGKVVGVDASNELISLARKNFSTIRNLSFQQADILRFETNQRFDLITAARTMQWMNEPKRALVKMKSLLKKGGCISILDYNHEKIEWKPACPPGMLHFYNAFLKWRSDARMDNQIADHLKTFFTEIGLKNIRETDESESSYNEDDDFLETAGIWKKVAETRGHQLVKDGYVKEDERLAAIKEYDAWLNQAISMKMFLSATTGYLLIEHKANELKQNQTPSPRPQGPSPSNREQRKI
jgi:ubiquinone/menaquinone biosynthesis C-methylase UbiE